MKTILLLLAIAISTLTYAQDSEPKVYFSDAVGKVIQKFASNSRYAYKTGDIERADFLFDSLVKYALNNSYLDDFSIRKKSGKKIKFSKFTKPVFLMTYASWCTPGTGEIPALNDIAAKYSDKIDFVVLFWDSKEAVRKVSKDYNNNIKIVYVDERENTNCHIIDKMKHSLGFPTSFFLDENKKILDIRRGVLQPYNQEYEISFDLNYDSFLNGIALLLNSMSDDTSLVARK